MQPPAATSAAAQRHPLYKDRPSDRQKQPRAERQAARQAAATCGAARQTAASGEAARQQAAPREAARQPAAQGSQRREAASGASSQRRKLQPPAATSAAAQRPPLYKDLKRCLRLHQRRPATCLEITASALAKYDAFKKSQVPKIQSKPGSFYWQNRNCAVLERLPKQLTFDKAESHEEYSYSVHSKKTEGMSIQVLLRDNAFVIKGGNMPDGRTTVLWSLHGGCPQAAFRAITKHVAF